MGVPAYLRPVKPRLAEGDISLANLGEKAHASLTGVTANQHHNRSHAITGASDHTATAWRLFYSDASGNLQELALGTAGHHLKSQGASAVPTWEAPPTFTETYTEYDNDKPPIIIQITDRQYSQSGTTWGDYYYTTFDWAEHKDTAEGGSYPYAKMGVYLKRNSGIAECRIEALSTSIGVISSQTVQRNSATWGYVETGNISYASTIKGFRHSIRNTSSGGTTYSIGACVILVYAPPVAPP